jgi:hypothetical protein
MVINFDGRAGGRPKLLVLPSIGAAGSEDGKQGACGDTRERSEHGDALRGSNDWEMT